MGVPLGWAWEVCRRLDEQDAADCRRELEKAYTLTEATLGGPGLVDDDHEIVHVQTPLVVPRVKLEPRPRPKPKPRAEPLQPRPHAEPTPAKTRARLDAETEERIRQRRRARLNLK